MNKSYRCHNLSKFSDQNTAHTIHEVALQRADALACMGVKSVLELCVGPSLNILKQAYSKFGISVVGNDIDYRWKLYHPSGAWVIGDALNVPINGYDAVVFAPPLSRGCSGKREDALSVDEVNPSYREFLQRLQEYCPSIVVLVLPGRSLATSFDREQYYHLERDILNAGFDLQTRARTAGRRNIVKYYDLFLTRERE